MSKIKKWTSRENQLIEILSKFGTISKTNIKEYVISAGKSISDKRLRELEKERYICSDTYNIDGKETIGYSLGNRGKKVAKLLDYTVYYSNSSKHDIQHSTFCFNIGYSISHYYNEKELDELKGGRYSRPDGAFLLPDKNIYIETITSSYSKNMIEAKRNYVEAQKGTYIENFI